MLSHSSEEQMKITWSWLVLCVAAPLISHNQASPGHGGHAFGFRLGIDWKPRPHVYKRSVSQCWALQSPPRAGGRPVEHPVVDMSLLHRKQNPWRTLYSGCLCGQLSSHQNVRAQSDQRLQNSEGVTLRQCPQKARPWGWRMVSQDKPSSGPKSARGSHRNSSRTAC